MRIWPNMSKNIFFLLRDRVVDIAGMPCSWHGWAIFDLFCLVNKNRIHNFVADYSG